MNPLNLAIQAIDNANLLDPNTETYQNQTYAKVYLYSIRMTEVLNKFMPNAPEQLQIAARAQHICRWEIARNTYPMDRVGYLTWRNDLKIFHAKKTAAILKEVGYNDDFIAEVEFLIQKKQLKKNKLTQALEDVICLVFLEFYFDDFAPKYDEAKLIDIVQKTWNKMSEQGHQAALQLNFSESALALIQKALA